MLLLSASGLVTPAGRRAWRGFACGWAAGAVLQLAWLCVFGSIAGYLAFHVITNQLYYARYIRFTPAEFFGSFLPSLNPDRRVHQIGLACLYAGVGVLIADGWRSRAAGWAGPVSRAFGIGGIVLLNARGSAGFPDGAFLVASIGLAALCLPPALASDVTSLGSLRTPGQAGIARFAGRHLPRWLPVAIIATGVIGAEAVARGATWSHKRILAVEPFHYAVSPLPDFVEIRRIVRPGERMLALVYSPPVYLWADRLPMRKYHEYLPWEADYARHPWFGQDRDLCVDLARDPPPLVYFDNWTVWDKYEPRAFMPCVIAILAERYERDPGFPLLYVRRDRGNLLRPR